MTQFMYSIQRIIGVLEAIEEHSGKNVTQIAKDMEYPPIISHINEMKSHGMADVMGSYYDGKKHVYLTRKGHEVLDMLRKIQERIEDDDGSDELVNGEKIVVMTWKR